MSVSTATFPLLPAPYSESRRERLHSAALAERGSGGSLPPRNTTTARPTTLLKSIPLLIPSQPYAAAPSPAPSRKLRPLSMSTAFNIPAMLPEEGEAGPSRPSGAGANKASGSGAARLKRLSLLSEPLTNRQLATPSTAMSRSSTEEDADEVEAGPSTPRSAVPPRNAGMTGRRDPGIRSSISYAPPSASSPKMKLEKPDGQSLGMGSRPMRRSDSRRREGSADDRRGSRTAEDDENGLGGVRGMPGSGGRIAASVPSPSTGNEAVTGCDPVADPGHAGVGRGVTLSERHADLLTTIAQKERRVSELKHELAQQESSLNQLKAKWTTIVSRSTQPFTTQTPGATSSSSTSSISSVNTDRAPAPGTNPTARRPAPGTNSRTTTSSSIPTLSSLATSPSLLDSDSDMAEMKGGFEDDSNYASAHAVLNNLLATAYGPEGVVTPSAVQGGKRFWGQLVKTVSAAAAGNVPGPGGTEGAAHGNGIGVESKDAAAALDIIAGNGLVSLPTWATSLGGAISLTSGTDNRAVSDSVGNAAILPAKPIRQPSNLHRLPKTGGITTAITGSLAAPRPTPASRHSGSSTRTPSPPESGDLIDFDSSFEGTGPILRSPVSVLPERTGDSPDAVSSKEADVEVVDEDEDGWGW